MRPSTLSEVAERVGRGCPFDRALDEFLDAFYATTSRDGMFARLAEEPPSTGDVALDAWLAAVAEYLARHHARHRPPSWALPPNRVAPEPVFSVASPGSGLREWFIAHSPAEFINHNVFTEPVPLRRARRGR